MYDLSIPAFLKIPADVRKKSWEGVTLTDPHRGGTTEAWRQRENERRAAIADEIKRKNAKALAGLKEQHTGETYDRKLKCWVRVERSTTPAA